ncbi:myb-like protein X [Penaeus japonicus]|uniref:myb-like protein X n=1 Tax=Penaeus japonicus TaxID=27405 RepID=UPI001C71775D|nr:myb-like protein X [Penaeus japonicus]
MRGTLSYFALLLAVAGYAAGAGYGCKPQIHYETYFKTIYNEVPVLKTVASQHLVPKIFTEVIYDTVYRARTLYQTSTQYITTTEYLTRVIHDRETKTVADYVYIPDVKTTVKNLVQSQVALITTTLYTTEYTPARLYSTRFATYTTTVTHPVTLTHKSQMLVPRREHVTSTFAKHYPVTVTYTVPAPPPSGYGSGGDEGNLVIQTNAVVKIKPSYVTTNVKKTLYLTNTNVERIPVYVTKTVGCGGGAGGGGGGAGGGRPDLAAYGSSSQALHVAVGGAAGGAGGAGGVVRLSGQLVSEDSLPGGGSGAGQIQLQPGFSAAEEDSYGGR